MRHINIPIFVPHLGCPHDCVFCNQKTITGKKRLDLDEVERDIESALSTVERERDEVEIAFFGGSFTGIERDTLISLLETSDKYVSSGAVRSVRCSTRPDYIDREILEILKEHHLTTIEIGVQSMSDRVLALSERGHSAKTTEKACKMIVDAGFSLVGQMMIGLPGSSLEDEIFTAKEICRLGAAGARIYPTVVFNDTKLCAMAKSGDYSPLTVDEAAHRSAEALKVFIDNSVKVIRIGLCESEGLHTEDGIYAGAFHPALGELTVSEYYFKKEKEELSSLPEGVESAAVYVAPGRISQAIGQHRKNKERIRELFPALRIRFAEDNSLDGYMLRVSPD